MKIRSGFVSNSSSTNFIIELSAYSNTLSFAEEILPLMVQADDERDDSHTARMHENVLARVKKLKELGIDSNIPIDLFCSYHLTAIFKRDNAFFFATDYDYSNGSIPYRGIVDQNDMSLYLGNNFMYMTEYDVIARYIERCDKPGHQRKLKVLSGEVICPKCDPNALESHQVTHHPEKYYLLKIPVLDDWGDEDDIDDDDGN